LTQPLTFRPAEACDSDQGAKLILDTLHQFGDHLFGFGDHDRALDALAKFFALPANRFSHHHTVFCQSGEEIAGILMMFDRWQMRYSTLVTAVHMFKIYNLKEIKKLLELMLPYRDEEKIYKGELYIAHLAVAEQFRRQGIGIRLLEYAQSAAIEQGKAKLSLLTEIENTPARALYKKFGFWVTDTIILPDHMRYSGSKGDVRMEKPL
jgi:ribosomal protein S18 acetylase RimI-like enzyme